MKTKWMMNFIICLVAASLLLGGCETKKPPVYDAGQYLLSGAQVDGEELPTASLYPEGGSLLLSGDGTGRLALGTEACDISWQCQGEDYSFRINELAAEGIRDGGSLTLELKEIGLMLTFDEGNASAIIPQEASFPDSSAPTADQRLWGGEWVGRLWFEEPQGEWADFADQTLSVTATVNVEKDGSGSLRLSSKYYSDVLPLATISFMLEEYKVHCLSGYMMSYPVPEWGMELVLSSERRADIEDTIIFHPDIYEYGHFYNADPPVDGNVKEDVLRLTGSCHDLEGGFDYKIVLTREES